MESWNCILRNISEKLGHNLSSEGRMSLFLFGCVWLFVTPWTIACQAPLLMGFPQVRILESVAISFSGGSSQPRDVTHISCIGSQSLYNWDTKEAICLFKNERTITPGEWKSVITYREKSASHDFNDRGKEIICPLALQNKSRHATWLENVTPGELNSAALCYKQVKKRSRTVGKRGKI